MFYYTALWIALVLGSSLAASYFTHHFNFSSNMSKSISYKILLIFNMLALLLLISIARVALCHEQQNKFSIKPTCGYSAMGIASWYGGKFHGRKTSSGAIFNKRDFTAAHNGLPLNSRVKITNLSNNRSIIVLINDRIGMKTRLIDVSEKTAEVLGFKQKGLTKVKVECL